MPELPEVETIRQNLSASPLIGRQILGIDLLWARTLATPSPAEFTARIVGQRILTLGRRGKFLLFRLSPDTLLIHLRMSGDLLLEPSEAPVAPHHRLILYLEGGLRLSFNDARKFGRVWLVEDPSLVLQDLGPEPLDPGLSPQEFAGRLRSSHRQVKPLLLDQTFLAGLGNIYSDEALFLAKLHPLTLSHRIPQDQAVRLFESIRQVLEEGIRRHGASIDWVYRGGDFQNYFRVYQRTGEQCLVCGTPIVRIVIGQRGTHLCPNCQPGPLL